MHLLPQSLYTFSTVKTESIDSHHSPYPRRHELDALEEENERERRRESELSHRSSSKLVCWVLDDEKKRKLERKVQRKVEREKGNTEEVPSRE